MGGFLFGLNSWEKYKPLIFNKTKGFGKVGTGKG